MKSARLTTAILAISATTGLTWHAPSLPAAAPAASPSAPTATRPDISREAQSQLAALRAAYSNLHSLHVTGVFSGTLTASGKQQSFHTDFDTLFSNGQFQHTPKPSTDGSANISFGSTGQFAYLLIAGAKGAAYLTVSPAVAARQIDEHAGQLAPTMWRIDPALALCVAPNSPESLVPGARRITTSPDVSIDGHPYTALLFDAPATPTTLLLDPNTHLLRRLSTTLLPRPGATGPAAISGTIVCDYPSTTLNPPIHTSFDWTPPPNAQQLLQPAEIAAKLKGHPAPDLTFTCLDGTRVTLSALKGHVVVLDFWATWCAPCIASLPNLIKINDENQPRGLRMFAIDAGENTDKVKDFIAAEKMTLPVSIDSGAAAKAYAADALPETVVIAKDGTVKDLFVGFSPASESQLCAAIKDAQDQP
jgi:thiol-disulfide isomerase/thioredoxin